MLTHSKQQLKLGLFFGILTPVSGTLSAACAKYVSTYVSVDTLVFLQYSVCLLLLLPWLMRQGLQGLQTPRLATHAYRSLSGLLCFYSYYIALNHISLAHATLLRSSSPLFVPLLATLWLNEKVSSIRWLGCVVGFLGILFVLNPKLEPITLWHLLALSSGVLLAISLISTNQLALTEPAPRILFYYFAVSTLGSAPMGIRHWQSIPLAIWPYVLLVGILLFLAMIFYTKAATYAPATLVAPTNYLAVPFSAVLSWFIWDVALGPTFIIGMLLVMMGGLLTVSSQSHAKPTLTAV